VDTRIRPPVVVRAAIEPERRRRWPWAVAVMVVAALAATLAWLVNVEPLGYGSSTFAVRDPRARATMGSVDAFDVTGQVATVPMKRGLVFHYDVSIRNDGPLSVTIVDVGSPSDLMTPRQVVAMKPDLYEGGSVSDGYVPFEPFDLPPGQEAGLRMEVRITQAACYAPGGYASWYREPVTYRIAGITRHADVETRLEVRLAGTRDTAC